MYSKLLITANDVSSSLILFTLMMEAIRSSEISVLTRKTRHHDPEDGILHIQTNLPVVFQHLVSGHLSRFLLVKKALQTTFSSLKTN
jgi:hypothetical protein